ncbi:MAG: Hpt domain-containing protein [Erysipelotrichaceae bacterium]|nr:Hpt domain-containing protein [Erysipelotrichaceae bacterium]
MLSIERLEEYGADVKTGLERCMNSEDFYFRMISMFPNEDCFNRLEEAIGKNDLDAAFEAAHALKGVAGNLSLTPLYKDAEEITELLRSRTQMDYSELLEKIRNHRETIREMVED